MKGNWEGYTSFSRAEILCVFGLRGLVGSRPAQIFGRAQIMSSGFRWRWALSLYLQLMQVVDITMDGPFPAQNS
jgi:hypothetical protein